MNVFRRRSLIRGMKPAHLCEHVNFLRLSGKKDRQLMAMIRQEDYTLLTNNRVLPARLRKAV